MKVKFVSSIGFYEYSDKLTKAYLELSYNI